MCRIRFYVFPLKASLILPEQQGRRERGRPWGCRPKRGPGQKIFQFLSHFLEKFCTFLVTNSDDLFLVIYHKFEKCTHFFCEIANNFNFLKFHLPWAPAAKLGPGAVYPSLSGPAEQRNSSKRIMFMRPFRVEN